MIARLKQPWIAASIGAILYLLTTFLTVQMVKLPETPIPELAKAAGNPGPSWTYANPEVDQLIQELKSSKEAIAKRETELKEWATRLAAERQEINVITQNVGRIQQSIESKLVSFRQEEVANLKKLAKTYSGMTPEAVAKIFRHMEEETVVKILASMKESETGGILEAMSKTGDEDAKRAAQISERLRLLVNAATSKKAT